jgi:D-alanine-D-alanine ligase
MVGMTTVSKQTIIGVLCGGLSSERDVSLRSGANCTAALKRLGYHRTVQIDVGRDVAQACQQHGIEVALLALHGKYGEDGCIQGLLEIMGIPYTGSGVSASATTINKHLTKQVLAQAGIPVAPSVTLTWPSNQVSPERKESIMSDLAPLGLPVMVKPVTEGSSVGMSKASTPDQLWEALLLAAQYSPSLLVEQFINGVDLTVGVLQIEGVDTVTPILQLKSLSASGWYDLEAKYTEGLTEFTLPAPLAPEQTHAIQQAALTAHTTAGCHGVSRTDFVYDPTTGQFVVLEINTLPGMTDVSDLPAQAKAMGIGYDQLVELILKTAYSRQS